MPMTLIFSRVIVFGLFLSVHSWFTQQPCAGSDDASELSIEWRQFPSIPDREGFASGFSGVSHGQLIFAGGANFPDGRPWEGGRKVWYDTVFRLKPGGNEWTRIGRLPQSLAYGVSVTWKDVVICVGGSDATSHSSKVFGIEVLHDEIRIKPFPDLPFPVANACGAVSGDVVYIAGGQTSPDSTEALNSMLTLNLMAPEEGWKLLSTCPWTGRILAIAGARDGNFYLVSGAELRTGANQQAGASQKVMRHYLRDAWQFDPTAGWTRMPDLPAAVVAAPSPAVFIKGGLLIPGGDDGGQISATPQAHQGFSRQVIYWNEQKNSWQESVGISHPRVTAPCVEWNGWNLIISGEQRPGIRSPEVWGFRIR
ncbi:MAG: hypothetical protein JNL58_15165 [Planctomyces sp.]|nr:hypothetical protein [Planctomyces sp.]